MSPPNSSSFACHKSLRQAVRMPRETDGVGNALRQIFGDAPSLPSEFAALLNQLKDD